MLPARLMLTEDQRTEAERAAAELEALCRQAPRDDAQYEQTVLAIIKEMMLALAAQQQSDVGVEASGKAYLVALCDVAWWAVAEAVRRWYCGEAGVRVDGTHYNYHWRPGSAELRRIARQAEWLVRGPGITLRRLLAAGPLPEFDDVHRATMLRRWAGVRSLILSAGPPTPGGERPSSPE